MDCPDWWEIYGEGSTGGLVRLPDPGSSEHCYGLMSPGGSGDAQLIVSLSLRSSRVASRSLGALSLNLFRGKLAPKLV